MPFDGSGNASVTRNIAITGQTVLAEQVNTPFADIQNMLSQVVLRSGVAPMQGSLNSNGFRQLNVGDPTSDSDGANKNYVDDQIVSALSTVTANARKIETVNANRLALLADKATSFRVTGIRTITLTAAATLLANWWCEVWAVDSQVTIDPDATETINGNATLVLNAGQKAIVFCTGAAFFAFVTSDAQSGLQLQGYSFGLALSNNATDAANDVDIASGRAAADVSPYNIISLGSALTKRIDAPWSVGSGNGGFDIGAVAAAGTYYIWLIQRSDTLVTDALFSLSSTAPTMPTNYDRKRLVGLVVRDSSVNGPILPRLGNLYYESAPQTPTLAGVLSFPHFLGKAPKSYSAHLVCISGEKGYAVGDEINVMPDSPGTSSGFGVQVKVTNTTISAKIGDSGIGILLDFNTGVSSIATITRWLVILRAWA